MTRGAVFKSPLFFLITEWKEWMKRGWEGSPRIARTNLLNIQRFPVLMLI